MAILTDEHFIELWHKHQSVAGIAKDTGMSLRNIFQRRRTIEQRYRISLKAKDPRAKEFYVRDYLSRMDVDLQEGVIFVASDAHYWPDEISEAHKAFVKLIKKHKPDIIVMNGDLFDGATISRFGKVGFTKHAIPTVKQELDEVAERLGEIEKVSGNAKRVWTMGNHDLRFEGKLANAVPEFEGVRGFSLEDHFPGWIFCMSMFVNRNLMVKHRWHNGIHATYNNSMKSGVSFCNGHLHRLQATIFSDYNGTRWGVDTGTLSEVDGDHMLYGEDNPKNHCSGFAVLTIRNGRLIQPEFCAVLDGVPYFRGERV
jgi:predicted phosphodiesterase